ncbi:MAG: APC family permease [Oscillospiraceae bacterium]|nr:APC family permease [Oscillospiraceae bacterium]
MATSTKDLKKVLTRGNLMSMAVGQIIGAGVMVMSISALGMTGRSVNIAFVIAAIFTVFGAIPTVFYSSVVRLRGGMYSQAALFVGETFSGFYTITYLISNCSMAMYAIGLTSYLLSLIPALQGKDIIVSAVVFTAFYVLNLFGTEKIAKVQDYMFYVLVVALLMFTAFGLPRVHWAGYFTTPGFDGTPLISNGVTGLLQAASFLTFATGGATIIVNFSAEAINPQKDIPFVIVVSTVGVAILYALLATCIGGILPAEEVMAAGNLSVIAKAVMPTWAYYIFVIGGACFALGTTLNASLGWVTKPLLQAIEDGWLPASLGKLNKYGIPATLLTIFYVINMAAILFGLDVSSLGQLVLIIGNVQNVVLIWGIMKLPKLFPEQWAKSPFHVSDGVFKFCLLASIAITLVQFYMNVSGTTFAVVAINAITCVVAYVYATSMKKAGKIHMTVSYDLD